MTLTLHAHPLSSYCWKALIALYETGAEFELTLVDFGDPENAAAFRALWPLAKMPVLVDREHILMESSTIIEHLAVHHRGHAHLIPDDRDTAIRVRMLDRIFDNYVMTPMQKIVGDRLRPADARDPHGVAEARRLLDTSYGWLEHELAGRAWAAGEAFSLADCAAAPSLHYADKVHPFRDRFPALAAYLGRLETRESFARVLEEAAPYRHLFPAEA
jgi:glutathione S-transferase